MDATAFARELEAAERIDAVLEIYAGWEIIGGTWAESVIITNRNRTVRLEIRDDDDDPEVPIVTVLTDDDFSRRLANTHGAIMYETAKGGTPDIRSANRAVVEFTKQRDELVDRVVNQMRGDLLKIGDARIRRAAARQLAEGFGFSVSDDRYDEVVQTASRLGIDLELADREVG